MISWIVHIRKVSISEHDDIHVINNFLLMKEKQGSELGDNIIGLEAM